MDRKKYVLSFDLGASSGRGIVFSFDGTRMEQICQHRFGNQAVYLNGTAYWDFLYLYQNILEAMIRVGTQYPISSMGIDTWGLDYGVIDSCGRLSGNPVSYRDKRGAAGADLLLRKMTGKELYQRTGTQFLCGNTIYQLFYEIQKHPEQLNNAEAVLMIPDLISYFLTGKKGAEYTIASTTQLLDMKSKQWNFPLISEIGLRKTLFSDIKYPGEDSYTLFSEIQDRTGMKEAKLVTVASHDTASAVLAVPAAEKENFIYISSGTWSVIGIETREPVINEKGFQGNFTNEGGFGKTIRYCRSLTGMWLIQECMRCWKELGQTITYDQMGEGLKDTEEFMCFIYPENEAFQKQCDMPKAIQEYCRKTGQKVPQSQAQIARCIYESLAMNYLETVEILKEQKKADYARIYIVGGGSQAAFLNQCVANATGMQVAAGISEATSYGNAFAQLYHAGEFHSQWEFREMLKREENIRYYEPENKDVWKLMYERYRRVIKNDGGQRI